MIKLTNVQKYYGHTHALTGVNLEVKEPGIYCLLGRNGAGKTTLLKTIAGHMDPSAGSVEINGKTVSVASASSDVRFIESNAAQFNMPLRSLFAAAAELDSRFDLAYANNLAASFNLDTSKKYRQLSFGMEVMANTILGMASDVPVLILDEPVLGFDAIMRKTFYQLLGESCAQKPKIVIVSTHLIDEIAGVASRLVILDKGSILLHTDINEIDEKAYSVTGPADAVLAATKGLNVLAQRKVGGFVSLSIYDNRIADGSAYNIQALGLQEFFISLVGGE